MTLTTSTETTTKTAGENGVADPRKGYVITVPQPPGSSSSDALALNLATHLGLQQRETGKRVCFLDMKESSFGTTQHLGVYTPNLKTLLSDPAALTSHGFEQHLIFRSDFNVSILLASPGLQGFDQLYTSADYTQVLDLLKREFDYIVIGCGSGKYEDDVVDQFALPVADYVVAVTCLDLSSVMMMDRWLDRISALMQPSLGSSIKDRIGVVLWHRFPDSDSESLAWEVRRSLRNQNIVAELPYEPDWERCERTSTLLATQGNPEIDEAFGRILDHATGKSIPAQVSASRLSRVLGWISGKN